MDLYPIVLLLFLGGAFTKSAQVPFHFWLPNAMEAPTPVSAFLHSATMVKAGVYLLARMFPILGNGSVLVDWPIVGQVDLHLWNIILVVFGGVTLLYGATLALRQTDMKQMLAQTTVASLGLLVLLLGVGTEGAITAAVVYLVAHALYKAAFFLVAGMIDHGTGTREITELGGLRGKMPFTFVAAILAGLSMAGIPLTVGFQAKEVMYHALVDGAWYNIAVLVVLVLGNALMFVVGAAIAIVPFMGGLKQTPQSPHEASIAMWVGPVLFGVLAIIAGVMTDLFGHDFVTPTASTIYNYAIDAHLELSLELFLKPEILISLATWGLGILLFVYRDQVRGFLWRSERAIGWNFDKGFDALMFGLVRLADVITRVVHNGRLEIYMLVLFIALALAVFWPLGALNAWPAIGPGTEWPQLTFYEWGVLLIGLIGVIAVLLAKTRLVAIVSLGIQGFAVALLFMLFGAPDLSFTQFMVEILTVVILALVMTRLHLERRDSRVLEEVLRDGLVAIICGVGLTTLLMTVLNTPLDLSLTEVFAQTSVPLAHGHNVVNVILVDYRGLDTFGEIAVVMTAAISILALIRMRVGGRQTGVGAPKKPARGAKASRATTAKAGATS